MMITKTLSLLDSIFLLVRKSIIILKRISSEPKLLKSKIDKAIDKLSYGSKIPVRSRLGILYRLKITSDRNLLLPCYSH